jgi:tetratricopeptide (TPR) repeat protein
MIRRLLLITALLAILLPHPAPADDGGTESVFNLGAGARAMGMGNGYTALAEDATAVYYNPAAMPYLTTQQISFLHTIIFEGTIYDFASYVYPHEGLSGFGVAAMRVGTDDIGRRDEVSDLGKFNASDMQLLLSYGRRIGDRYSAGANLKLVHQSIDDYSAYGYGLDLSGRASLTEKLRAGLLLQDIIGARLKLVNIRERTPFTIRAGLAYETAIRNTSFSGIYAFDLEKPENRDLQVRTGLELAHSSGLALRGGYDRDNFTLGMGLRYQQLTFDYAFKFMDNLTDSHRFSFTFSFGPTSIERQAEQAEETRREQVDLIQSERRALMEKELAKAEEYFKADQLDSALAAYYRADAFADSETRAYISLRIETVRNLQARQQPSRTAADDAHANEIINHATELMEKGELKAARDVVDAAISSKIDAAELFVLRREITFRTEEKIRYLTAGAEQDFDKGNYIESYNKYNGVLSLEPGNVQARNGSRASKIQVDIAQHLKLALDYFNQERYILSQREFNSVLQLDPNNETARKHLRSIDDRLRESGTQAERDLRQDQEMWQVYLDGVEAYRGGDFKKAIELWNKVLKKYPADKMTLENKRQAELRVKD